MHDPPSHHQANGDPHAQASSPDHRYQLCCIHDWRRSVEPRGRPAQRIEQTSCRFLAEVGPRAREGRIKYRDDFVEGLEKTPRALIGLLRGENIGKLIERISPEVQAGRCGQTDRLCRRQPTPRPISMARLAEVIDDGSGIIAFMVTRRSKLVPTGVPAGKGPKSFLTNTFTESDPLGSENAVPAGNGRVGTFDEVKIAFCMVTRLRPASAPLVTSSSRGAGMRC